MRFLGSKGFSTFGFMTTLPLLLSLMAGTGYMARNLFQWNKMNHECQRLVLDHQNDLRKILTKLMALNPKAQKLIIQKKAAQVALVAAIATKNPVAISTAKKRLNAVIAKQKLLKTEQKLLMSFAKAEAQKFKWKVRKLINYSRIQTHKSSSLYSYPLALRPVPKSEIAPRYLPVENFEQKQNIGLSFSAHISQWNYIKGILNLKSDFKIECGSTLKQENQKWYTHLNVAKPLLNL